jgi:hypothetical protein
MVGCAPILGRPGDTASAALLIAYFPSLRLSRLQIAKYEHRPGTGSIDRWCGGVRSLSNDPTLISFLRDPARATTPLRPCGDPQFGGAMTSHRREYSPACPPTSGRIEIGAVSGPQAVYDRF